MLETPETPDIPETPEAPFVPLTPETPLTPLTPETPFEPKVGLIFITGFNVIFYIKPPPFKLFTHCCLNCKIPTLILKRHDIKPTKDESVHINKLTQDRFSDRYIKKPKRTLDHLQWHLLKKYKH